jgi:hypothetical protein
MDQIKRFKFNDLELEFSEKISLLEERAMDLLKIYPDDTKDNAILEDDEFATVQDLIAISPRAGILDSWSELEDSARIALTKNGMKNVSDLKSFTKIIRLLIENGIFDIRQGEVLKELHSLRNHAAHRTGMRIDEFSARSFAHVSLNYASYLRRNR